MLNVELKSIMPSFCPRWSSLALEMNIDTLKVIKHESGDQTI